MHPTTEKMLNDSPSPLRWGLSMLVWLVLALLVHHAFFILFGIAVGLYFGNYKGRFDTMEAWQNEIQKSGEETREQIEKFFQVEREHIQRKEIFSDKSHWRNNESSITRTS